jgi:hypothetical protein
MSILDVLMGRPLANWEESGEQIGPSAGIPIFGLDALSSAAYGPEAALTLLIPLGMLGVHNLPVGESRQRPFGEPATGLRSNQATGCGWMASESSYSERNDGRGWKARAQLAATGTF